MTIDERLDHYIARCDALDAEGIGALLKEIKEERAATLRQHPERGVTEAMVERAERIWMANDGTFSGRMRLVLAALSAEPAAQGEAVIDAKYDDVLVPFARLMAQELHANAGKGDRPGWLSMTPAVGMLEIYYHAAKLQKAVKDDNGDGIREYAADVANMAMMLLDLCGGLAVTDTAPPAKPTTCKLSGADLKVKPAERVPPGWNAALREARQRIHAMALSNGWTTDSDAYAVSCLLEDMLTASPAPSEGGKGVDDDPPTCPICDQMKLSARCSACGYEDDPTTGAAHDRP